MVLRSLVIYSRHSIRCLNGAAQTEVEDGICVTYPQSVLINSDVNLKTRTHLQTLSVNSVCLVYRLLANTVPRPDIPLISQWKTSVTFSKNGRGTAIIFWQTSKQMIELASEILSEWQQPILKCCYKWSVAKHKASTYSPLRSFWALSLAVAHEIHWQRV